MYLKWYILMKGVTCTTKTPTTPVIPEILQAQEAETYVWLRGNILATRVRTLNWIVIGYY